MGTRVGARTLRFGTAIAAALSVSVALLQHSGHGQAAVAATQTSSKVAVIPAFHPAPYPGYVGVPKLPVGAAQLSAYNFTALAPAQVTPGSLAQYDTVILYGIRWSDFTAAEQAAINAFAKTGKVLIWDADDTGAQSYATFVHPFSTSASGETHKKNNGVVSFPGGNDFLASSNPGSPYYLDPNQLVADPETTNDMSVMNSGATNWVPALSAANGTIPNGGWLLAWTYGNIGNQTGMTIYSGMDADGFAENSTPNYTIKELGLELAAPFATSATSSCAPNCSPPPPPPPSGSGGGGGGGGGHTFAACSLGQKVPTYWVRRLVPIVLKTSVAAGISGKVIASQHDFVGHHQVVATGNGQTSGVLQLPVNTTWLRSNHQSHLVAWVYVKGVKACSLSFRLNVDNDPPRLLLIRALAVARRHLVVFKVNEKGFMRIVGGGARYSHWRPIPAGRTIQVLLPRHLRHARLIVRDRAGNQLSRSLR